MINGGFLDANGEANRDNNYILDHVARLRDIPVNVVHGRYDRVCHLYQAEALVRALRSAGNNGVNYFITTAGHSSFEPETDTPRPGHCGPSRLECRGRLLQDTHPMISRSRDNDVGIFPSPVNGSASRRIVSVHWDVT